MCAAESYLAFFASLIETIQSNVRSSAYRGFGIACLHAAVEGRQMV
jgi:hypothetical protein